MRHSKILILLKPSWDYSFVYVITYYSIDSIVLECMNVPLKIIKGHMMHAYTAYVALSVGDTEMTMVCSLYVLSCWYKRSRYSIPQLAMHLMNTCKAL